MWFNVWKIGKFASQYKISVVKVGWYLPWVIVGRELLMGGKLSALWFLSLPRLYLYSGTRAIWPNWHTVIGLALWYSSRHARLDDLFPGIQLLTTRNCRNEDWNILHIRNLGFGLWKYTLTVKGDGNSQLGLGISVGKHGDVVWNIDLDTGSTDLACRWSLTVSSCSQTKVCLIHYVGVEGLW